jgi:oligogalacturonide lyase
MRLQEGDAMKRPYSLVALLIGFLSAALAVPVGDAQEGKAPPTDWIEPATGHRVLRLSTEAGTSSFYFHQQSYTEKGDKLIVSNTKGFAAIDLTTLGTAPPKIEQILEGKGASAIVGKKTRQIFYMRGGSLYATHIDTKKTREIAKLPAGLSGASGLAINADETLIASTGTDPEAKNKVKEKAKEEGDKLKPPPGPKGKMTPGGRSMVLFTVNIASGEVKKVHYATDWLNHTQFSPTDPEQILFCHEGTWHEVDRVWTIRTDGTGLKLLHQRTMIYEIAGHEFFGSDGKMAWYDLQTPRAKEFWLAGVDLKTGERLRFPLERSQWSVHYNQSHDGKLFAGDGGGPDSVANKTPMPENKPLSPPGNGQWVYLFTPQPDKFDTIKVGNEQVKVGKFAVEKLVDMSNHKYKLEPNVTFTPDNRWIVFRSNMHGPTHVYAVEVKKSK